MGKFTCPCGFMPIFEKPPWGKSIKYVVVVVYINNSLVVSYPGFVLVRVNLKEDNFFVLQAVYETENSKLIMILRSQC